MPKKLSQFKVGKILKLYFQGYSQTAIAHKLNIDQSTVSFQVGKFKARADEVGIAGAAEEMGIMDEIEMLHSLAVDLMNEKLTVEEAVAGLRVVSAFEKLGIEQDYQSVIKIAAIMHKEGFLDSAIKLDELEQNTGMTYEEIADEATKVSQQLEKDQAQLKEIAGKLDDAKNDLTNMESKKKLTTDDLTAYMEQIGVDQDRLKKVETLAQALKKAGIQNQQLEEYLQRQQQLNEAGISIDMFTSILEKTEVATTKDKGKMLLDMLTEYGGLSQANQALKLKINALEKEATGLEEKATLKGKIQADIDSLKAEKASLEPHVSELHAQKDQLGKVKSEVSYLSKKQTEIEHEIANIESYKTGLTEKIKLLEETTGDLEERKAKHDAVSASLSETKAKLNQEKRRLELFESFLSLVQSSSIPQLENFIEGLPYQLSLVKTGSSSPELLWKMIIRNLTRDTLQVLRCSSCEVKFVVDKPSNIDGYRCPVCGLTFHVKIDKDALAVLKAALAPTKHIAAQGVTITPIQPPLKDKDDG